MKSTSKNSGGMALLVHDRKRLLGQRESVIHRRVLFRLGVKLRLALQIE
jgi:hypothetical protein